MIFKLPIGDWSKDGHNQCDFYTVDTNIPTFKELVDLCLKVDKLYNIQSLCGDYEENYLNSEQAVVFYNLGIDLEKYFDQEAAKDHNHQPIMDEYGDPAIHLVCWDTEKFANFILDLFVCTEKGATFLIVNEDIPTLDDWSKEKPEGSTIPNFGYGLHS